MQGQELSTSRIPFAENNESDSCGRPPFQWSSSFIENDKIDPVSVSQRYGQERILPFGRHNESSFSDLLSGFGSHNGQTEGKFSIQSNQWSAVPSNLSLNLTSPSIKGSFDEYTAHGNRNLKEHQHGKWMMPPPLPFNLHMPKMPLVHQNEVKKSEDGNFKIFGVNFSGNKVASDATRNTHQRVELPQYPTFESDQRSELSKGQKVLGNSPTGKEIEKQYQNSESQPKVQGASTRSCTKVLVSGCRMSRLGNGPKHSLLCIFKKKL